MSSQAFRNVILGGAVLAVAGGLFALFASVDEVAEDEVAAGELQRSVPQREPVRAAPQPAVADERPDSDGDDDSNDDDGDDDDDYDDESRTRLSPPGVLPDRGPEFDPHNLVMTGDVEYDRKTRRSAAHRLFDTQDYPGAVKMAREILAETPDDIRLNLLVVRAACAMGEVEMARTYHALLPEGDRGRPLAECTRFGVELDGEK